MGVSAAEYTTWLSGATQEYSNVPAEQTTFGHQDDIVGIIAVNSADVQTKTVTLVSAEKTHYSDSSYTILADSSNGDLTAYDLTSNEDTTNTGSDWVAFQYTESSVPLETTHYIRYTATVELDYFLGQRRRRSLLQVDTEDVREQTTSVDAAVFAQASTDSTSVSTTNSSPDDAIVVIRLQNCADSTPELLQQLEQATRDPFNELHGYIYSEQDIPSDMTIDSSVFFVQQQPQTVLTADASTSSTTGSSESSTEWYMYAVIGATVGALIAGLYIHQSKKSSSVAQPTQERRYSVAELLASN